MFEAEFGLIFWTSVSFFILLGVLGRWGLPPLLKIIKERDDLIKKALQASADSKIESEKILQAASSQAASEKEAARAEIYREKQKTEEWKQRSLDEARAEARSIVEEADTTIARHRAQVVRDIRSEVAAIIVEATQKFLRHRLTPKDHEDLLKESLTELDRAYDQKRI